MLTTDKLPLCDDWSVYFYFSRAECMYVGLNVGHIMSLHLTYARPLLPFFCGRLQIDSIITCQPFYPGSPFIALDSLVLLSLAFEKHHEVPEAHLSLLLLPSPSANRMHISSIQSCQFQDRNQSLCGVTLTLKSSTQKQRQRTPLKLRSRRSIAPQQLSSSQWYVKPVKVTVSLCF